MWRARRATPAPVALAVGNNTERALNARLYSPLVRQPFAKRVRAISCARDTAKVCQQSRFE